MRILSIGGMAGLSNTCLHRHWALEKVADEVDTVDTSAKKFTLWYRIAWHLFYYGLPVPLPEASDENKKVRELVNKNHYDIVWIDKGLTITADTLRYIRQQQPNCKIVSYTADNMALRHNQSQQFLKCFPLYDVHITTKSYIIDDLKQLGAKKVIFTPQSYATEFHHQWNLSASDRMRLGCDVGFVGTYELERAESMLYLAQHGIKVRVFGSDRLWRKYRDVNKNLIVEKYGLYSEDYSKSFQAFKISLCFLKKINYDLHTSRTMEIPACGGFMLAERTAEHQSLFVEDKEAVYFSSNEELLEKCRYYLSHDTERETIARAGHQRCITSDYSNEGMVRRILKEIIEEK